MKHSKRRRRKRSGIRNGLFWLVVLLLAAMLLSRSVLQGLNSRYAVLLDAGTGQVLAGKRADTPCDPASLTKMMTVLVAIEQLPDLEGAITLPEEIFPALYAENASMAGFCPGETVTVRDLLYGAMLPSGAECCAALAVRISGSEQAFVEQMNRRAQELGMKDTHFCNPTGLTEPEHKSTASDLAKVLWTALQEPTFREVFTTKQYTTTATQQHPEGLCLSSTLLSKLSGNELEEGEILGGKTGYTSAAGLCLASLAQINGKEYLLVTLDAPGDHTTTQYNIEDALCVYARLSEEKNLLSRILL